MPLIIQGALYQAEGTVLRAQYTGEFGMVDCDEYITKEEMLDRYDESFFKEREELELYITVDGVKYYEAEYGPWRTDDFNLLSDLSELRYFDEETDFD